MSSKPVTLIGYSGHSYVIYDIFQDMGRNVNGYCESEYKDFNPYKLKFYGSETSERGIEALKNSEYFIAIGNNAIRKAVQNKLLKQGLLPATNAIHPSSIISPYVEMDYGIMVAQGVCINAQTKIGKGVVCNTSCVIEHEVEIGDYAFIAPNTTILGGAKIGENCFIGAGAVVLQNVKIGENSIVGAGAVVLKDIPANSKVVGNPQRFI